MNDSPTWQFDEMKQIGRDFGDPAEVEAYDARHRKFRNIEKENDDILEKLCLQPEQVVMDIGTGTGAFALQAARRCAKVYAVDISRAMLEYAKMKASKAGVTNIVFRYGGFLSYSHDAQPVDAIVTSTALHHLPDFWKSVALHRLNGMLKTGGQLYLSDVIFEDRNVRENIERFLEAMENAGGPGIRRDIDTHIRNEFSTYDWIVEGLLERSGFRVTSKIMYKGVIGRYLCRKEMECAFW